MGDEEAEFDFLYTALPQLEKLMKVYATTAVKLRVQKIGYDAEGQCAGICG